MKLVRYVGLGFLIWATYLYYKKPYALFSEMPETVVVYWGLFLMGIGGLGYWLAERRGRRLAVGHYYTTH